MSADRFNQGKLRWALVDFESLEELVKVLEFGAVKYSPENWKGGLHREEVLESTLRHLIKLLENKEYDDDSKLHHMGHVLANAMFYLFHFRNNSFSPDRANPFNKQFTKQLIN